MAVNNIEKIGAIMTSKLYFHGSGEVVTNPELRSGKYAKDFGKGFYCTEIREQAVRWAKRKNTSIVNLYQFPATSDLKILEFKSMTSDWLDFISNCRNADPSITIHDYDFVVGPMADDQVYNHLQEYIDGNMTKEQFALLCAYHYPTRQICFTSQKSLDYLEFQKFQDVSGGN